MRGGWASCAGRWALLALVGTPLSTAWWRGACTGCCRMLGLPTPFIYCLLFGALISPTDPVAVLSILTKANVAKDAGNEDCGRVAV